MRGLPPLGPGCRKAAIKIEENGTCSDYPERKQARPKVKAAIKLEESDACIGYPEPSKQ